MKALVIGQGGREHAIVKALSESPSIREIHAVPGNDGMSRIALCHKQLDWKETEALIQFCVRTEIDFVIIGPEDPLVFGLADLLRNRGILVFGPSQEAAQLEGSKIYAKNFMKEAKIPTSHFRVVSSVEEVLKEVPFFTPPYVLKADGLAAGKGVYICENKEELLKAAEDLFEKKIFGPAGEKALLEQYVSGWEMSFLFLTNGDSWQALPLVQDHKRLFDNDKGPNTGGMGTVAPLKIENSLYEEIIQKVVEPSLALLKKKTIVYRGVLFLGLMITQDGSPYVLEYNCRFGDPETQVILPLIDGDWGLLFKEISQGGMPSIKFKNISACCLVMASPGYPENPEKNLLIEGDLDSSSSMSYFLHAGTYKKDYQWYTQGGRVLCSLGFGSDLKEAQALSYQQAEKVTWKGLQMRKDIGAKLLKKSDS